VGGCIDLALFAVCETAEHPGIEGAFHPFVHNPDLFFGITATDRPFPVQKLISTTDLYRVRVDPQEA
jgi:hypothetical protein